MIFLKNCMMVYCKIENVRLGKGGTFYIVGDDGQVYFFVAFLDTLIRTVKDVKELRCIDKMFIEDLYELM